MHTLIAGAGFSGTCIAQKAIDYGSVSATRRTDSSLSELISPGVEAITFDGVLHETLRDSLNRTTHLVISVPPAREAPLFDPVLNVLNTLDSSDLPSLRWIGYLSTIGVYGDHAGAWIDETAECRSTQVRSMMRLQAENAWRDFANSRQVALAVLRLSGIYGPGRNALVDALNGRARVLIKPGQVFNRIHVHDLADATLLAAVQVHDGIINVTDDLPAPAQEVVRYAHDLLKMAYPPEQAFALASMSDMARSFYSENKRISNARSKSVLGMRYRYTTYKEGLDSLFKQLNSDQQSANIST